MSARNIPLSLVNARARQARYHSDLSDEVAVMRGIRLLLFIACAGSPLSAQTIGTVDPPSGCHFEEVSDGARYECEYENESSNRVHLIFLEQVLALGSGGPQSLSENAPRVTRERIDAVVASYAATYNGLKGRATPAEDVTDMHFMALYCAEGGGTVRLTGTVDFDLRVRECAFAPGPPGMMPDYGVVDTILYSEFFPTERPAMTSVEDARSIFRSLAISMQPVPFEATASEFQAECTNGNFGEMCERITAEVFEYGEWIAPYWPLQVSQQAWLECLDRLRRSTPFPWRDGFSALTDETANLPAQMVLFDSILRTCDDAAALYAPNGRPAAAAHWNAPVPQPQQRASDR